MLISTCLILAIRTSKWSAGRSEGTSDRELEEEIEHAAHLAGRVLSKLVSRHAALFPSKSMPWYQPNEDDVPK